MTESIGALPATRSLRLVELLGPLSIVTDMGMGSPDERAMRTCLLATGLARRMNLPESTVADVYYATLLKHLGCTATAHEEALRFGGDEIETRPLMSPTDFGRAREVVQLLGRIGSGRGPVQRARIVAATATGTRFGQTVQAAVCEVAAMTAERLGMPAQVSLALSAMYARWDGKGVPAGMAGEDVPLPARFAQVADRAMAYYEAAGTGAAVEAVAASSGGWFDPAIAAAFAQHADALVSDISGADAAEGVLEAEPRPYRSTAPERLESITRAFADMVDLKMPFTIGHSTAVAEIAAKASERLGFTGAQCRTMLHAGHLHDLGRVGVAAGIWARPSTLSRSERERLQLHAYYSERIVARTTAFAGLATVVGMHHERLDGSGYHRSAMARDIAMPARLLAAADAYRTMLEDRPHRAALAPDAAAERFRGQAASGALDIDAVDAILAVAGQQTGPIVRDLPAGLTARELEVLRLIARGCSNQEVADELVISRRTAEHHVQHIYDKIGVSTRAGASMFAVRHDLLSAI